jgi:hypothetical protein
MLFIFFLNRTNVHQLNDLFMLSCREYAGDKKKRFKPIIISHHMLMGLKEGQEKMSKSDPDSAIFMEDSAEDIRRKVGSSYSLISFPCLTDSTSYDDMCRSRRLTVPRRLLIRTQSLIMRDTLSLDTTERSLSRSEG